MREVDLSLRELQPNFGLRSRLSALEGAEVRPRARARAPQGRGAVGDRRGAQQGLESRTAWRLAGGP